MADLKNLNSNLLFKGQLVQIRNIFITSFTFWTKKIRRCLHGNENTTFVSDPLFINLIKLNCLFQRKRVSRVSQKERGASVGL